MFVYVFCLRPFVHIHFSIASLIYQFQWSSNIKRKFSLSFSCPSPLFFLFSISYTLFLFPFLVLFFVFLVLYFLLLVLFFLFFSLAFSFCYFVVSLSILFLFGFTFFVVVLFFFDKICVGVCLNEFGTLEVSNHFEIQDPRRKRKTLRQGERGKKSSNEQIKSRVKYNKKNSGKKKFKVTFFSSVRERGRKRKKKKEEREEKRGRKKDVSWWTIKRFK